MSPFGGRAHQTRQSAHESRSPAYQPELRLPRAAGRRRQGARKGKSMARSARRPGRQAQVAGLLVAARVPPGARVGAPPGAPPDKEPPKIVHVKPESGAVVPNFRGDAEIQFNEV